MYEVNETVLLISESKSEAFARIEEINRFDGGLTLLVVVHYGKRITFAPTGKHYTAKVNGRELVLAKAPWREFAKCKKCGNPSAIHEDDGACPNVTPINREVSDADRSGEPAREGRAGEP